MYALENEDIAIALMLLDAGCSIEIFNNVHNVFCLCPYKIGWPLANPRCMSWTLEPCPRRETLNHWVAGQHPSQGRGSPALLLQNGARPLHFAVAAGATAIVTILLQAGAGPSALYQVPTMHARSHQGLSPRQVALLLGQDSILPLLPVRRDAEVRLPLTELMAVANSCACQQSRSHARFPCGPRGR